MVEVALVNLESGESGAPHATSATAEPQPPRDDDLEEDEMGRVTSESSTLQWDSKAGGKGAVGGEQTPPEKRRAEEDRLSVGLAGQESRTESERELGDHVWPEGEMSRRKSGKPKAGSAEDHVEVQVYQESPENRMPDVFSPGASVRKPSSMQEHLGNGPLLWRGDPETSPFLGHHRPPPDTYYQDWPAEKQPTKGCCSPSRDALKVGVSVFMAALLFPLLVWGGYCFLPFDAPLLNSAPLRLVYTLRCSVFAVVPIVLGVLVLGVSRLRSSSVKPLSDGGVESREVAVHQRFVSDSVSLFLLYFLQLAVMASYLQQEHLKLVPLLTIVFAFGRLIYWLAAALGSSVRGVGFGMSFLPMVAMLGANLYFIFTVDAAGSIFALEPVTTPEPRRQRFWG